MGKTISDQDRANIKQATIPKSITAAVAAAMGAGTSLAAIKAAINAAKPTKPQHRGTGPQARRMGGKVVKKRMYGGSVKKRK